MSTDLIARGLAARSASAAQSALTKASTAQNAADAATASASDAAASADAAAGSAVTAAGSATALDSAVAQVAATAGTIIQANLLSLEDGIAAPRVMTYASTAGRWRLTATGFVPCAANEERLCYDSAGRFLGTMLQAADTYYSAPWHDTAAAHTASDPAYLTTTSSAARLPMPEAMANGTCSAPPARARC